MIDILGVWLPQIVGYAAFISDTEKVNAIWRDKKSGITSVVSFEELIEQIYDDLDSENILPSAVQKLAENDGLGSSLQDFFVKLDAVDKLIPADRLFSQIPPTELMPDWSRLQFSGKKLVREYSESRYTKFVIRPIRDDLIKNGVF